MLYTVILAAKSVIGAGEEVKAGLTDQVAGFFQFLIGRVPAWIAGFVVFIATFVVAKIVKGAVESRIESQVDEEHQEVMVLAGRVSYFGTVLVGITIALKIAGIDLTALLAALAFGVGFALQDLIMNFLSGVFILVSRQFTIGDFIKVGNTIGKVVEIQTRATILKAIDGTKVIVPNSEIFTSQVTSFTTNPMRRVVVPLYVSYDTDLTYATKVAIKVMKQHPKIQKKPAPSVIVSDYGDSTIDLSARFWVGSRDGWFKIKSEIMHQMWDAFMEAGIVVPYNVMHLETNQDTQEEWQEAEGISKKRMVEMGLSKAIEESTAEAKPAEIVAAAAPTNGNGQGVAQALVDAVTGAAAAVQGPAPVAETVSVEPPGVYSDQEEIDGMA